MVVYGRPALALAERHPVFFRSGAGVIYFGDVLNFTESRLEGFARFDTALETDVKCSGRGLLNHFESGEDFLHFLSDNSADEFRDGPHPSYP